MYAHTHTHTCTHTHTHTHTNTHTQAVAPKDDAAGWCDKHQPTTAAGLGVCVYAKTIKRVRKWMEEATGGGDEVGRR